MPYKSIDNYPIGEQEAELERRRKLRRDAKRRSRKRQAESGVPPRKDTRRKRNRPDMAEYMRKRRAKDGSAG